MAFAEKLIKDEDIRNAAQHLKHARNSLKKTRVDIDDKNKELKKSQKDFRRWKGENIRLQKKA